MLVVSEAPRDRETQQYMAYLRNRYDMAIHYCHPDAVLETLPAYLM